MKLLYYPERGEKGRGEGGGGMTWPKVALCVHASMQAYVTPHINLAKIRIKPFLWTQVKVSKAKQKFRHDKWAEQEHSIRRINNLSNT